MKEQTEEKQVLENQNIISTLELFVEKYKKALITGVIVIVVAVAAVFALKQWYFNPRSIEAAEEMFAAENYFDSQEYEKALNGDQQYNRLGFIDIINDYSGTKSANLARYYAGICELRLGHYEEAIEHLKKYSGKDSYTQAIAFMAQGDAESELGNQDAAIALYEKAAQKGDNELVAPSALFKAAILYINGKNYDKAISCLQTIKDKYPESSEYASVDKFMAVAEQLK